jgi:hypothetical protein
MCMFPDHLEQYQRHEDNMMSRDQLMQMADILSPRRPVSPRQQQPLSPRRPLSPYDGYSRDFVDGRVCHDRRDFHVDRCGYTPTSRTGHVFHPYDSERLLRGHCRSRCECDEDDRSAKRRRVLGK